MDSEQLNWTHHFPKIRDRVYELNKQLCDRVKSDIELLQMPVVEPMLFSMKTTSSHDLSSHCATYQWNQMLLEALRRLPQNDRSRQDMVTICRVQYHDDPSELRKIERFEKTYQPQSAISWYTQDCFIHKVINKALQTEDIDIIFKFRSFVIDLYDALSDLHNKFKTENSNVITVYRGQQMEASELNNLKASKNTIISLKSFLSTTKRQDVALIFAGDGSNRPEIESVLFEITIDVNRSHKPLADISNVSHMSDENEVLLSMGMLFVVQSVKQMENNVWKIQLTATDESRVKLNDYLKNSYSRLEDCDDPLFELAILLNESYSYGKAEKYLLMLLEEYTENPGKIYNVLGICNCVKHNYRRGLYYYIKALNCYIMEGSSMHPVCCHIYNNIGQIYAQEEDYERAMSFYKTALEIHLKYPTVGPNVFVRTLTRIGDTYERFGNYDDAFKNYFHAHEIVEHRHLNNDMMAARLYSSIGAAYLKLGQYNKSLQYCKRNLEILQGLFADNKLPIACAYQEIGGVYDAKGEYDEALRQYKEAERIYTINGIYSHVALAGVYGNIGVIYRKKEEYELALYYLQKSLQTEEQFEKGMSISIAKRYNNIGVVYHSMGNIEQGIEYTRKAINCIQNAQTPDESELGMFYSNLASYYADQGNTEQALHYCNFSLEIKRRVYPSNHPTFARTFSTMGTILALNGDISMAIHYYEMAVKIYKEVFDVNHPEYKTAVMRLTELKHFKALIEEHDVKALKSLQALDSNRVVAVPLSFYIDNGTKKIAALTDGADYLKNEDTHLFIDASDETTTTAPTLACFEGS
ncbi:unnamed protein product [Adineta ricciae]|uniref:ADP ribosyltransferase domain-containing protein n=1 Tax=Adineta ricciae TaxID=249248 RepID=A0A815CPK8_ADIRI|nr:unnamed protein product [Adineta ricciae]CAF1287966.1 unnamed protein product [Adineta ricciae]